MYGLKWYKFLKKNAKCISLEQAEQITKDSFIVRWALRLDGRDDHNDHRCRADHWYGHFDDHLSFFKFYLRIPENLKSFSEILMYGIKGYFDVDLDRTKCASCTHEEAEAIKDSVVDAVLVVFSERGIALSLEDDILVYESHGHSKFSYHIVVNNYYFINIQECAAFYETVVSEIRKRYPSGIGSLDDIVRHIDNGVYHAKQNFRLIGSGKLVNGIVERHKKFREHWTYHGTTIIHKPKERAENAFHRRLITFEESLVGFVAGCNPAPTFKIQQPTKPQKSNKIRNASAPKSGASNSLVIEIFQQSKLIDSDAFEPNINDDDKIELKRVAESYCPICLREHENENAWLSLYNNRVYYGCYRAVNSDKKSTILLGNLNKEDCELEEETDDSPINMLTNVDVWSENIIEKYSMNKKESILCDTFVNKKYSLFDTPIPD
jgi:hypothetical protein